MAAIGGIIGAIGGIIGPVGSTPIGGGIGIVMPGEDIAGGGAEGDSIGEANIGCAIGAIGAIGAIAAIGPIGGIEGGLADIDAGIGSAIGVAIGGGTDAGIASATGTGIGAGVV